MMESPSKKLADIIIARLVEEKLLLTDDGRRLLQKLAEGNARPEDWRLSIEKAAEKEMKP